MTITINQFVPDRYSTVNRYNRYSWTIRSWERTPGFRDMPRRELPVQPYQDEVWVLSQVSRDSCFRSSKHDGEVQTVVSSGPYCTGDNLVSLRDNYVTPYQFLLEEKRYLAALEAETKLLVQVADTKVNLGVMYAEAKKTSDHIYDTAKRLVDAYRSLRKGRFGDVARHLHISPKTAHKSWLEYKYGWMPLLMDVKGAAELFAQQHVFGGRPPAFYVTQKYLVNQTGADAGTYDAYGGGAPGTYSQTVSYQVKGKLRLRIEVVNQFATQAQQLGLTNPALVLWELVPFSFVFDWFISVGDWLTAMTALQGLRVTRGFHSTEKDESYAVNQPSTFREDGSWNYYNSSFQAGVSIREYVRRPYTPTELPRVPVQGPASFQKLTSSLALLKGSTSRSLRV